ncbi:hypothetical protein [Actibacterium pelagium]|uniref:Uncharacterized protein n=1 Tax=Actibacterium pelagium TaxID=2029103 RepID=A0A917EKJ2_9RHOB|nr:hypothetical protein [Actibacterium pelagium]GGE55128.1 hypothetical protein GCM10011517_23460 [Actibacterium pelagium]
MATTLNDKNIKSVLADIPKKGFRTKFWREHRSRACKGSGVAKYLDQLEAWGLPPSGDPAKADLDQMGNIVQGFSFLSNAMLKAGGKCGKAQKHSEMLCKEYRDVIKKLEANATKLAQNAVKIKAARAAQDEKIRQQNEKSDKIMAKMKEDQEGNRKLFLKEIVAVAVRAKKIEEACKKVVKDVDNGVKLLEAVTADFKSKSGKEGVDQMVLEATAQKQIMSIAKKQNIAAHGKSVGGAMVKLQKDVITNFKQFKPESWNKKEMTDSTKAIKAMQTSYGEAKDSLKFYTVQHKIALDAVQKARGEGG